MNFFSHFGKNFIKNDENKDMSEMWVMHISLMSLFSLLVDVLHLCILLFHPHSVGILLSEYRDVIFGCSLLWLKLLKAMKVLL